MRNRTGLSLGLFALMLSACTNVAAADPQTYVIDSDHTHVSFTVDRFGFAKTLGIFPSSSGEIRLDEDNPAASSVTAKVSTKDLWMGLPKRDEAVHSKFWLNTAEFGEISFASTTVSLDEADPEHATVTGDLTILGVTKSVEFDVKLNQIGPDRTSGGAKAAGFSMHTTIKRSDFGNETALKFVGDDVHINIETIAHLKNSVPTEE